MAQTFTTDFAAQINTVLAEEANRIGGDIHKQTLHTSPWIDLIKQTTFPDESGYNLTTLIYDRVIPVTSGDTSVIGNSWGDVANSLGSTAFGTNRQLDSTLDNNLTDAMKIEEAQTKAYAHLSKKVKQYNLQRAAIESPRISVDDLRFAAHRTEQLRAITDALSESARFSWETRYRDEFERLSANIVICETASSAIKTLVDDTDTGNTTATEAFEGMNIVGASTATTVNVEHSSVAGAGTSAEDSMANISNAILDKCYYNLIRKGAGSNAYGRENGRPVFALVCSSEASYQLQTEAGFRDDVRYNNAKVSDLIAPLGIEKSFRGFYHLIDDTAPRFAIPSSGIPTKVLPYTSTAGVISMNASYDTAEFEAAYIIHPDVMESQIPTPLSGAGGVTFNATNYKGDFKWLNIPDVALNPDGNIGFFRGVLASASKPIKTDFGFVILFKRDSSTPAA
jgi:hypothetical protein